MMTVMSTSQRSLLGTSLIVLGLLAAACSSSDGAATSTTGPTEGSSPASTEDISASATPELPAWVRERLESGDVDGDGTEDALQRYVAFTGGGGVAHRSACDDAARLSTVWAEGTTIEVVPSDSSDCDSWTLVTDGETTSWVRDKYLSDEKPLATGTGGGGVASYIQVLQYGQGLWQIPLSEIRVVPASETWCELDSWHDPEGGDYLVHTIDGTPFVNPDPVRCGFGAVSSAVILWVPAP